MNIFRSIYKIMKNRNNETLCRGKETKQTKKNENIYNKNI